MPSLVRVLKQPYGYKMLTALLRGGQMSGFRACQASDQQWSAARSTRTKTEGQKRESQNKTTRSAEMIYIPATLLRTPILWDGFRRPFGNPVIDRYGSDERKQDSEDLDSEGDCCESPSGLIQMFERQ